jgi:pimeloyl-ACP methyl ester carboxylesterase
VYFGSLNRLMDSPSRYQTLANLPPEIVAGLEAMIYEQFGRQVLEAIVNEQLAAQINVPALLFHDTQDRITPIDDSRAIASAWKRARLIETSGLDHRGGLRSSEVHAQVARFLSGD